MRESKAWGERRKTQDGLERKLNREKRKRKEQMKKVRMERQERRVKKRKG